MAAQNAPVTTRVAQNAPLTVYYDASCPLCASEMSVIAAHDERDTLALVDCSSDGPALACCDVPRDAMMRSLHARTADGRWLVGVAAYEAIFRAVRFERLARIAASRRLRPLLDRLYALVARNRHRLPRRGLAWLARFARRNARAA